MKRKWVIAAALIAVVVLLLLGVVINSRKEAVDPMGNIQTPGRK